MIALNSMLLMIDTPSLNDKYQTESIDLLFNIISIIFVFECLCKMIVKGFYWGDKTYLKDSWNVLDFIIVLISLLTWFLEIFSVSDTGYLKGFKALRALRPLRVVSKNEGIKVVVNALLKAMPSLMNVILIIMLFLVVFGILGV